MPRKKPRLADVPRLLELKQRVRRDVLGEQTASSVAAFIAWKALILASQAEEGIEEVERLEASISNCLRKYPAQLRPYVVTFIAALRRLSGSDITPSVQAEWVGAVSGLSREIERVLRSVKRLSNDLQGVPDAELWTLSAEVTAHLRRVRNVVIGHPRVTTSTPLFPAIVAPFEELVSELAELQYRLLNV